MTACPKRCPAFDPHHPMQKPTSTVSFLLIATACVLVVLGIIAAVNVYQTYAALADAASRISPGLKIDHFLAIWVAGATFFGSFCTSLILAALAQITEATAESASQAEMQTEYLRQIAATASRSRPTVDETAQKVASGFHL